MDFGWLLLTYGDVTVGAQPTEVLGARYALCIGVEGEATFWVFLTSVDGDNKQRIPDESRMGPWANNKYTNHFPIDQVWIITREMAFEAHARANEIKGTFKHNYVKQELIRPWPAIPTRFPKNFTPLAQRPPVQLPTPRAAPSPLAPASAPSPAPTDLPALVEASPVLVEGRIEPLGDGKAPPAGEEISPEGAPTPDMPGSVPEEATPAPADPSREESIAHAVKLLSNPRLTSQEVADQVRQLGERIVQVLLGG